MRIYYKTPYYRPVPSTYGDAAKINPHQPDAYFVIAWKTLSTTAAVHKIDWIKDYYTEANVGLHGAVARYQRAGSATVFCVLSMGDPALSEDDAALRNARLRLQVGDEYETWRLLWGL
ncbi:hypothetical protein ANO11243_083510 [Dothideomycetidae sp. 11243]|nr:hypothetical protein ANO11243_083510 [fungal sp. No.11243]